jgi:selenide,water dikinase
LDGHLFQESIPIYSGARALSDAGLSSTLMPENSKDTPIDGLYDALLYDPQTAGGLLASVPKRQSAAVIKALGAVGCTGYVIGRLSKGTGRVCLS